MNNSIEIPKDQLIINEDGSIFHLHIKPSQLRDNIILVGDPSRVEMISSLLDFVCCSGKNREFCWVSGSYKSTEITIISTGIGSDNIDIVMNEIDAVANISFTTRKVADKLRKLNIIRLGTCGVVDSAIESGSVIISKQAVGIDSLLNFYRDDSRLLNYELSDSFAEAMEWSSKLSSPFAVDCSDELFSKLSDLGKAGITVTAPGFYAPQGRMLRIARSVDNLVDRLSEFSYGGLKVTNLEMEAAPMMAMSRLMGHNAITLCIGIAARQKSAVALDYNGAMMNLAQNVLDKLCELHMTIEI